MNIGFSRKLLTSKECAYSCCLYELRLNSSRNLLLNSELSQLVIPSRLDASAFNRYLLGMPRAFMLAAVVEPHLAVAHLHFTSRLGTFVSNRHLLGMPCTSLCAPL